MTRRTALLRLGPLAAGGTLLAHTVAYGLVHGDPAAAHAPGHGYLPGASAVVAPLAITALVLAVAVSAHDPPAHRIRVAPLLGLQAVLFLVQELVEHVLTGDVAAMGATPVVWTGLVVQAAIAVLLVAGVRRLGRAVSLLRLLRGRVAAVAAAILSVGPSPVLRVRVAASTPVGLRAPPAFRS